MDNFQINVLILNNLGHTLLSDSQSTKQTEMAPGEPATYKKPAKEIPQYSSKFKVRGSG